MDELMRITDCNITILEVKSRKQAQLPINYVILYKSEAHNNTREYLWRHGQSKLSSSED